MRRLFLVRHAKACGPEAAATDFERPLSRRGEREAGLLGRRLAGRGARLDRLLTSGAARALATAREVAAALDGAAGTLAIDDRIYAADAGALLALVRGLAHDWTCVMLVGHNPAMTDLVNALSDDIVTHVPTSGVAEIEFDGDDWAAVGLGQGRLAWFDYPKNADG